MIDALGSILGVGRKLWGVLVREDVREEEEGTAVDGVERAGFEEDLFEDEVEMREGSMDAVNEL